jgi:hypothetical protein
MELYLHSPYAYTAYTGAVSVSCIYIYRVIKKSL